MKLVLNKAYAQLGDSILNFVVSAGLTFALKKPCGIKVADKILRRIITKEEILSIVEKTVFTEMEKEDILEALIAYAWLKGIVSIDELIEEAAKGADVEESTKRVLSKIVHKLKVKLT
ncbi:MAG: hypothetical protein DRJ63_09595 [Thermoprotei archaeon]|nr:MAG: hypothetical protein DRJ63_09595 [Thermoprotei archaeon]